MRLVILSVLFFCGLVGNANAQKSATANAPPYTGTAIGAGYTFTGQATSTLFAANIGAYNLSLPISISLWVSIPNAFGSTQYYLNGLNQALTDGFTVYHPSTNSADSLLLETLLQPSATNCAGARRMCANMNLISDGNLHHLCVRWTSTGSAFYVDGVRWAWGPSGATFTANTTFPWIIGESAQSGTTEVDVAVWSRALTASECATIYNRGKAGMSLLSGNAPSSLNNQLVAYWSLSNCSGTPTSCPDGSTNNNPATIDPAPTVVASPVAGTGCTGACVGTVTLSATCTDTYAVQSVQFQVDNTIVATDTTSPYSTTFDSTLLDDVSNPHTMTAVCTNIGGITASDSATFSTNNGTVTAKTYYMSATGNDSNNGTSSGTPWLTPLHNVRCGDTILAAPSSAWRDVNFFTGHWGTVWSCPTAVGTTGIYYAFLKCNGSFVQDCYINTATQGGGAMRVSADNWAIQGWTASATQDATGCFTTGAVAGRSNTGGGTANNARYVLWLNDYAKGCTAYGFGGADYTATVGSLAWGNTTSGISCYNGIAINSPVNSNPGDTGTHLFTGGTFSIHNFNPNTCTDGEGMIFDSWYVNSVYVGYNAQAVVEQSLIIDNGSEGFYTNGSSPGVIAPKYLLHSTVWGNGWALSGRTSQIHFGSTGFPPTHLTQNITVDSNISVATGGQVCKDRTAPFTCPPGAFNTDYALENDSDGSIACPTACVVTNNYLWDSSGEGNFISSTTGLTLSGNTMANPGLAGPATVPTAPDCSASATVFACVAAIRANFVPSGGASALGYQPPATCVSGPTCQGGFVCVVSDPYYPVWLKGAVPDGLLTKPCGY